MREPNEYGVAHEYGCSSEPAAIFREGWIDHHERASPWWVMVIT